jgi:hypothetical protein
MTTPNHHKDNSNTSTNINKQMNVDLEKNQSHPRRYKSNPSVTAKNKKLLIILLCVVAAFFASVFLKQMR